MDTLSTSEIQFPRQGTFPRCKRIRLLKLLLGSADNLKQGTQLVDLFMS